MSSLKRLLQLMAALLLMLSVVITGPTDHAAGAPAPSPARLRVAHTSPDAPAMDIYLNAKPTAESLPYQMATQYVSVVPGTYTVQVAPAGAPLDQVVIQTDITLEAGKDYTVAAVGRLAAIKQLMLVDERQAPGQGKAHIRVVHASPDAPAVDIAVKAGPVLVPGIKFGEASQYIPVDAKTYELELRMAGTNDVALSVSGFAAESGKIYTVIALGEVGKKTLGMLPLVHR